MKKLLSILMLFASFSVSAQVGKWAPVSGGTVQKNSITGEYRWVFTGAGNTYDPTALYAPIPTAPVGANHIITRMGVTITSSKGRNIAAIDSGVYFFNGDTTAYTGAMLRISSQDAYLSLYDVLYVDSTGTTNLIEGDLSATPSVPTAPDNTLVIAQILVTPTSVTNVPVPPPTYVTYNSWTGDVNGTGHKLTISYLVIGGENTSNINLQAASSTPGTPLNGINIYDKGGFSWIGSDSFTRTLSDNNTANRNYHLPDTSGTFALKSQLPDLSGYATLSDLSPYALNSALSNYLPLTGGTVAGRMQVNNTPTLPTDVMRLGDMSAYATLSGTPNFVYGLTSSGVSFVNGGGQTTGTMNGNSWAANSNGVTSKINLSFGVYLKPGYEGVYANDYTTNTELFHFGVPNEADEQSRIDENFQLNFAVPAFTYQYGIGQLLIKDITNGQNGAFAQLPITDFGINVASGDVVSQTAANSSVATFHVQQNATYTGVFNVQGYLNISSVATDVIEMQVTYTDENNVVQTVNFYNAGATSPLINSVGNSQFAPILIKAKTNTDITISTNLTTTGGSINYGCGGTVQLVR